MRLSKLCSIVTFALLVGAAIVARAQSSVGPANGAAKGGAATNTAGVVLPTGYVIGPQDVLSVVFWREKDMSADVTVRPDGKISLPLLNDIQAAGYTPDELRGRLVEAASKFLEEPNATVVVKEIRSRNVSITGNVVKPAMYPLNGDMTVLQLIALAGGLQEYADKDKIVVIRSEGGRSQYHMFNYNQVVKQKNVQQNIPLKPGDTVVVP
jgi:polysaccharide export outer membrane protein